MVIDDIDTEELDFVKAVAENRRKVFDDVCKDLLKSYFGEPDDAEGMLFLDNKLAVTQWATDLTMKLLGWEK